MHTYRGGDWVWYIYPSSIHYKVERGRIVIIEGRPKSGLTAYEIENKLRIFEDEIIGHAEI